MAINHNRVAGLISIWGALFCIVVAGGTVSSGEPDASAKLPQTFEKVWYRSAKTRLFKAFAASGTLTVSEDSVRFTSRKINLDLAGEELVGLQLGRMKGDFVNEWAILSYKTADGEVTVGFKDGRGLGWGSSTNLIHGALQAAVRPTAYEITEDVSSTTASREPPFEWDPGFASPGTSLSADVLQTMSRPPNGMVTISIKSNGFADAAATLALWQKTGNQFSKYTPAILADGTVQLLPGVDETILGGYILGQPFDFALVDEATNKRSHAKIVPFPIAAQSAGRCRASAEVQTQSGLVWLILLAGYAAGEQVEIASTVKRKTLKTDAAASATGEIAFPVLYPPRSRGNARVRAAGARGCNVSLDFAIGSSALKAK